MADKFTSQVKKLLKTPPCWPEELTTKKSYIRLHDDHDGTKQGKLCVLFGPDGDAYVSISGEFPSESLRFRAPLGGGRSPMTRNALIILALAMKWDNENRPD